MYICCNAESDDDLPPATMLKADVSEMVYVNLLYSYYMYPYMYS